MFLSDVSFAFSVGRYKRMTAQRNNINTDRAVVHGRPALVLCQTQSLKEEQFGYLERELTVTRDQPASQNFKGGGGRV